jgi:hypothetical protein
MARPERLAIMAELEQLRGSRVISFLTGTRAPNYGTIIAADAPPLLYRHLERLGKVDQIDLFLYSQGGHTLSGFRIPALIREYCKRFCVLVPYRAHSAATLIALGADEIVMTPLAELSPVDPSTNGPFNPAVPISPAPGEVPPTYPVSVEDAVGYLNLARDEAKISDDASMRAVFEKLATDVRPLALGQVFRARSQIRMLVRKLLGLHTHPPGRGRAMKTLTWLPNTMNTRRVTTALSEKLLSHDYLITRAEAKALGLKVKLASADEEPKMFALYRDYEAAMQLSDPFNLETVLPGQGVQQVTFDRAFIESTHGAHIYRTVKEFRRAVQVVGMMTPAGPQQVQQLQQQERIVQDGWVLTDAQP